MGDESIYEEKARFVRGELTRMLRVATRGVITGLEYEREGAVETVHVLTVTQPFAVCVTADSLFAIVKDVTKAVEACLM